MSIALVCLLPFLAAALPPLAIRHGRTACALTAGAASLAALALLLSLAPAVWSGEPVRASIPWIPGLGLNFSFFVDGLGLFFAGMILVIGLLIIVYARVLSRAAEDPMGQFYAYLLLFQGAMLGIVLSDNILLLVVFWELTSLSSFLLIGFWQPPARRRGRARAWR